MQDMRTLKSLKPLNFLLNPNKTHFSISLLPRQIHFSSHRLCATGDPNLTVQASDSGDAANRGNAARVWTIYNPITERIEQIREMKEEGKPHVYGDLKESSSSGEDKTQLGAVKSSDDSKINFSGDTYKSVKEENLASSSVESKISSSEESYKSVKEENYENGGKARLGLPRYSGGNEDLMSEKRYRGVQKSESVNEGRYWGVLRTNRKAKSKLVYVCESCGHSEGQWWGYCRSCGNAAQLKQFSEGNDGNGGKVSGMEVSENMVRTWLPQSAGDVQPLRLTDVSRKISELDWRIPLPGLFGSEVARVLGGGLAPGSLVLVGGDPGVGKSTLLLQIAGMIAEGEDAGKAAPVLYVSGEESVEQIGNRADRLGINAEELFLYSSTDVEDILEKVKFMNPRALIIDSIQTVYLQDVTGSAGSVSQVKECTSAFLRFAKRTNIPVILIGHVTKSGDIAGPRILEHIVDVVLYMEGEKYSSHRLLRPMKNRFGSIDELGVFEMSESGLQAVSNPSEIFLSEQHVDSEVLAGLAVAVIMDGSRSFLIEVQALSVAGSATSRHVNGIQASKADMIISVLRKQAGLMLQDGAIFLNVVSGVTLTETAGDLAIAAAICSSFLEQPIPSNVAFIGEIGLGGELRAVPRMEKRVNTVAKLGYSMCIVPELTEKSLKNLSLGNMQVVGCNNLKEVISTVFK